MAIKLLYMKAMKTPRTEQINVKVSPDEKQAMTAAAQASGLTFSAWLRFTLLTAIKRGK